MSESIDTFNLMTYDFTVSDIANSPVTAPNSPFNGPKATGVASIGAADTIRGYIKAGVPPDQLMLGYAFYGHTWCV